MAKYKKIFIPGWMDTVKNRVNFDGIDIWKNNLKLEQQIDAEYIIGHSAGANIALLNWRNNKDTKLILVGPMLPKRNILVWTFRMIKFWVCEWTAISKERFSSFRYIIQSLTKIIKIIRIDLIPIVSKIPKDNLIIIRGENDHFFFDKKIADELRGKGINIIEINGVGHNWNQKFLDEIDTIIN